MATTRTTINKLWRLELFATLPVEARLLYLFGVSCSNKIGMLRAPTQEEMHSVLHPKTGLESCLFFTWVCCCADDAGVFPADPEYLKKAVPTMHRIFAGADDLEALVGLLVSRGLVVVEEGAWRLPHVHLLRLWLVRPRLQGAFLNMVRAK